MQSDFRPSPVGEGHPDILLDGHVHFHRCFDHTTFFDSGLENLRAGADRAGLRGKTPYCLLLTEGADDDFFERAHEELAGRANAPWSVGSTAEANSLLASRDGVASLVLIAGRQIATREGLEVLAIGTRARFARGLALREAIEATLAHDAIAVIPWGFGKWWLARGRLLEALLRARDTPKLFLGDNSGRPQVARASRLFALARERGFFVLPGSDPLPFPDQVRNVGRYGFGLAGALDQKRPAASVKGLLTALTQQPRIFGTRESIPGFVRAQVGMQLRKRRRA